jgi:hypothetical protein
MLKIRLPKPSISFINKIEKLYFIYRKNIPLEKWPHQYYGSNIDTNMVVGLFSDIIKDDFTAEYGYFFKVPVRAMLGVFANKNESIPAFYPPHVDNNRKSALNYYLKQGGDNVYTSLYNSIDYSDTKGKVSTYNDLNKIRSEILETNQWYALDSRRYHSLENIYTDRLLISVSMDCNYEEFLSLHKDLID